jgi:hypothetical protein
LKLLAPETASTIVNGSNCAGMVFTAALKASAARLRAERADSISTEIEKSKSIARAKVLQNERAEIVFLD